MPNYGQVFVVLLQCNAFMHCMYVCDNASKCIRTKMLKGVNISCTLQKMMNMLKQKIGSEYKK
jgi:hypothetical protein